MMINKLTKQIEKLSKALGIPDDVISK